MRTFSSVSLRSCLAFAGRGKVVLYLLSPERIAFYPFLRMNSPCWKRSRRDCRLQRFPALMTTSSLPPWRSSLAFTWGEQSFLYLLPPDDDLLLYLAEDVFHLMK
jgi:hypothetical protein